MLLLLSAVLSHAQGMSDAQVMRYIQREAKAGTSQSQIAVKLMQRGVDIKQIQRVKRKYERQIQQSGMGTVADEAINNANNRLRTNNGQQRANNGQQRNSNGQQRTGSGSQMLRQHMMQSMLK